MPRRFAIAAVLAVMTAAAPLASALAERRTVLDQIDVPHNYYFREMYLPQLTSGPSALSWSPDGTELVYAMQGSLWRQPLDSGVATELTSGAGYDYQPDWSPDGARVVFTRYDGKSLELAVLELASGEVTMLTDAGAVNTEPRWSPDGRRIAWVSTADTGRFHVFVGEYADGALRGRQLVPEREATVERYYYSGYDHELSPAWLPGGDGLVYVSNRGVPYGTGNLWRHDLDSDDRELVRREETSWRARPDVAPDGQRIAFASYLGREWHQLWVTHIGNVAEPFPLTYGDYDVSAPRWSPDGARIAYVANEHGDNEIRIQEFVGGAVTVLGQHERRYRRPMGSVRLRIVDAEGEPVAARLAVVDSDGRARAPADAWVHADHEFDRGMSGHETAYFHADGSAELAVPAGRATVIAWRGPEHEVVEEIFEAEPGATRTVTITIPALELPADWVNWLSGDVHVHMNYGGTYRATPKSLRAQARAEDLDVVFNLVVNKEQRVPDVRSFSPEPDPVSDEGTLILHQQEYHTSVWGHLGLLGLDSHLLMPDYSAYPYTAAASWHPDNVTIAELARDQGALVGYVHPFDAPAPDPAGGGRLTNMLPVNAALGLVDYYEVTGFADHRTSAGVWYRLLNCGARIAAAGGTDAMTNYASLRGPVGLNRTYVRAGRAADSPAERRDAWLAALAGGASLATNMPLVGLTVDGARPGSVVEAAAGDRLQVSAFLRSAVPVGDLELVYNGEVVERFAAGTSADVAAEIRADESGWLVLRASGQAAVPAVLDQYPYATTSPVYVTVDGRRPRSPADAAYFLAWLDRVRDAAAARADYNSEAERSTVLGHVEAARPFFEECR